MSLIKYERVFDIFFSQNWSFFAPPPQYNSRLIYVFKKSNSADSLVFEALEPITQSKREAAPLNAKEEVIDYVISGSVHNIGNFFPNETARLRIEYPDSSNLFIHKTANDGIWSSGYPRLTYAKTLYNYGKVIAQKQKLSDVSMQIIIARYPVPKFADRNIKDQSVPVLEIVSQSPYYSLSPE